MSFKVEIEIEPHDEEWCNDCKRWSDEYCYCYIFDKQLNHLKNTHGCLRCPECLEAEKQYKEKENA